MITKMNKLTFLLTNKEYEQFLAGIRELGVVHIEELKSGATSPEFEVGKERASRLSAAISALDNAKETWTLSTKRTIEAIPQSDNAVERGMNIVELIESLQAEELSLKHKIDAVDKNISVLEPWGEFDMKQFEVLKQNGYQVNFFAVSNKMFKAEWGETYFATPINEIDKKVYFITFSPETPDITAESIDVPNRPLSEFLEEKKSLEASVVEVHDKLLQINSLYNETLQKAKVENENEISLSRVHLNTESVAENAVKLLVGWVPEEKASDTEAFLNANHIFYEKEEPTLEDNVPVEIKNGKYSSLFEPILKMYSLPSYHDLDVTPFFAPFFMLFFGLCMGDAGYGALILAASIILLKKLPADQKPLAKLGVYLGAMTIVCGALTGSFFGIDLTQQDWAFLAPIKDKFINEKNFTLFGYSPMMVISVIIGLIQVLLGMALAGMKAAKLFGWRFAVGKMSWVTIIISAIICFGVPACGVVLPQAFIYILYVLMAISALGIFFYNAPDKNLLVNFGGGVWATYGMATGLLGDLLSYIRLFALGLTGGVLGGVFNQLSIQLTESMSWGVRWLPMLIILLLGHGINFGLCMISSFVHPMRLTFVEFFKNAEFEGGGKEYTPFKVKTYKKA